MKERIKVSRAIIVEGKYDKIKLSGIVEGLIIPTNGFSVFKDKPLLELIKKIAAEHGLIVLTDSDKAGMLIRSYIKKTVGTDNIINIYLPQIHGKEKRKIAPSAEGLLGVEGIEDEIIAEAIKSAVSYENAKGEAITKLDLYDLGVSGKENSSFLRAEFERYLNLPDNLSANYLLEYLNFAFNKETFLEVAESWQKENQRN